MSEFEIKKASRQAVKPLISLYSESGCGKTYSALLLGRGLVGLKGRIVMADSESGRGSLYADVLPGGYETLDLCEPFSPARYVAAIDAVEKSGAAVGILDSGSHEWEGIGGVLDLAGANEERSGKSGLHNWREPKMEHAKFVQKLLKSPIPWIVCLRAKYKTRQAKDDKGKTVIVKDEATSPIQAEDFIFESTCHAEILQNHSIILTKCSHPDLRKCFPGREEGPITIAHGEALARWCAAAGGTPVPLSTAATPAGPVPASSGTSSASATDDTKENRARLKAELWKVLKPVRGEKQKWDEAEKWLRLNKIMGDKEYLGDATVEQLGWMISQSNAKLDETGNVP